MFAPRIGSRFTSTSSRPRPAPLHCSFLGASIRRKFFSGPRPGRFLTSTRVCQRLYLLLFVRGLRWMWGGNLNGFWGRGKKDGGGEGGGELQRTLEVGYTMGGLVECV